MALDLLSCMKSFIAVAKYNGFSNAARHSHMSVSSFTKQVKWLEDFLGKVLFLRTRRRLQLTEAGEVYLIYAREILEKIAESKIIINDLEKEPHGQLTIGFPSVFDAVFPLAQLKMFLNQYRKIKLRIITENSPAILVTGTAELVISTTNTVDKQFVKEHLFTGHRGIYAAPDYIKTNGIPKNILELAQHNFLINSNSMINELIFSNKKKIKLSGNYVSDLALDCYFAAIQGMGLICAPISMVKEDVKTKRLVKIKLEADPVAVKLYLYYLPSTHNSNVKLMANFLKLHSECCR